MEPNSSYIPYCKECQSETNKMIEYEKETIKAYYTILIFKHKFLGFRVFVFSHNLYSTCLGFRMMCKMQKPENPNFMDLFYLSKKLCENEKIRKHA